MNKLSYIRGTVVRKTQMSETDHATAGDHFATGGERNYFRITVGKRTFNASEKFGKKINAGQEFAFVIDRTNVLLMKNINSGKIYGAGSPWSMILTVIATILFNVIAIPLFLENTSDNLAGFLGLNTFFLGMTLLAVNSYRKKRKALRMIS